MKDMHQIIRRPLLSEKTTTIKEDFNQVTFEVDRRANKIEVKNAVEQLFDVKVDKVRIQIVHGKQKRLGRFSGKRPNWKKAIITLQEGNTIELFEGV